MISNSNVENTQCISMIQNTNLWKWQQLHTLARSQLPRIGLYAWKWHRCPGNVKVIPLTLEFGPPARAWRRGANLLGRENLLGGVTVRQPNRSLHGPTLRIVKKNCFIVRFSNGFLTHFFLHRILGLFRNFLIVVGWWLCLMSVDSGLRSKSWRCPGNVKVIPLTLGFVPPARARRRGANLLGRENLLGGGYGAPTQ